MQTHEPVRPADPVDLTRCDREPIHIPGSIQPHGVLLAVTEPELIVVQASTNTAEILGIEHAAVLGAALPDLLDEPELVEQVRQAGTPLLTSIHALPITIRGRAFEGIVHRSGGLLVLELEPASGPGDDSGTGRDVYARVHDGLGRIEASRRLSDLWLTLAALVREISGFDRVMIYRFDERDGSGEVIAEQKRADMEPYLGLRYPASDVPKQARRLYLQNRLRLIGDAAYRPAPVVPADNPLTGSPLDLGGAVLRSVSPVHCAYLANMGVRASMSVSLIKDEKLWGLIVCHHREPRFLPHRVRVLCGFLGDVVSWMLRPRLEAEESQALVRADVVQRQLVEAMARQPDLAAGLVGGAPSALDLVDARGVAVAYQGRVTTRGVTPSPEQIEGLLAWLEKSMDGEVYATDTLSAVYPPAAAFKGEASGLLVAVASNARRVFLLWFRPEAVREVRWAGDPSKPVDAEAQRLSPLRSFALWKETVHDHSLPWASWELSAAAELRSAVGKVILQRTAESLNIELQRAVQSRDELLSMASHELKTPTTALRLHIEVLRRLAERGRLAPEQALVHLTKAERQLDRFELLINQILDVSRIAVGRLELDRMSVDLGEIVREAVERFDESGVALCVDAAGDLRGHWDRFQLDQVLTNLISNAIKYGQSKPVDIVLRGDGSRVRCAVRDRGIGISAEAQGKIFERFERAAPLTGFAGFGLGLWIARQIIECHGGHIEVKSEPGEGCTFTFELGRGNGAEG